MMDNYQICPNIDQCLVQLGDNDRLAVATSKEHATNNQHIPSWKLSCFSKNGEKIQTDFISMFVRRNHHLYHDINKIITMALEGGLFVKWGKLSSQLNAYLDLQRVQQHRSSQLPFEYIYPAFVVYMSFNLFAVFIFMFEHFVHYRAHGRKPDRLARIGDLLIDGQRHFLINIIPRYRRGRPPMLRKRYKTSLESKHTPKFGQLKR